jgi:hypothetical protein
MNKLKIANTIRDQLGEGALFMLGAVNLMGGPTGLRFRIRGCDKISHIEITLASDGTYTVIFSKWSMKILGHRTVSVHREVYPDNLHGLIERITGLSTRIPMETR